MQITVHERKKPTYLTGMILLVLFTLAFILFTYTFLHESGHALIGFMFGQKLTAFHIDLLKWDAHVSMVGNMTPPQQAIQSIAGAALPLLVWFVGISLVPRKGSFSLEVLKLAGSMVVLNTLLAWIILPVLFIFGRAPSDDVTHFLRYSQMPPWLLAFTAVVLYARGWGVFLSKIDGLRNELLLFRTTDRETIIAGTRTTVPVMTSILILCIALTFALNNVVADPSLNSFSPPQGFEPVAQIDLSKQAYSNETLAQFTLDEATFVGVFLTVRNINTTYFDLSVIGPEGYTSIVLHGEGYNTDRDGGLWEEYLLPGTYQVVLTSHQSPGTASVHLKTD